MNIVRHTDEEQCFVKSGTDELPAFLHPMLSTQQMAKVCMEDGTWRDVWWSKIRLVGVSDRMDEYDWDEEE